MPLIKSDVDEWERESTLKGGVESDLKYQIKKVLYICEQLGLLLDRQYENKFLYHEDERLIYFLEFLTGDLERLINFYYKWVVFCGLGFKEDVWNDSKDLLAKSSEEVLNIIFYRAQMSSSPQEKDFLLYEKSKNFFTNSTKILFSEGVREILAIGRMMKVNRCKVNYLPKIVLQKESGFEYVPLLYLVFNSDLSFSETSVSQEILSCGLNDDHKIDKSTGNLLVADIFNEKSEFLGWASSNMRIFDFDGVEFVVSKGHIGMSLESFIRKAYDFCRVVSVFVAELSAGESWALELCEAVRNKTHRKPKTLKNNF